MTKISTPRSFERATNMRDAFHKALVNHPEHTKLSGMVYRALSSYAGFVPKRG